MLSKLIVTGLIIIVSSCGSSRPESPNQKSLEPVGGPCEGCEAIYESPVPFKMLKSVDTLPDFYQQGPKISISGIVYQSDGCTPAQDVVIYMYHTNQGGRYTPHPDSKGWAKRHGYIRGWVKTDHYGRYRFFTLVPASYPNTRQSKHIHPVVKEPGKRAYYIDEYLFEGDPFLTTAERNNPKPRGGAGVIKPVIKNGMLRATRDIILGRNIPGYPVPDAGKISSGLPVGANCPAFDPLHLCGADEGKHVCPMCKYGYGRGIMIWLNNPGLDEIKNMALQLEGELRRRNDKGLRIFVVYIHPLYKQNDRRGDELLQEKIQRWCRSLNLRELAVLWAPSPVDGQTCGRYHINPAARNTVLVYKERVVVSNHVNIDYDRKALHTLMNTLDAPF